MKKGAWTITALLGVFFVAALWVAPAALCDETNILDFEADVIEGEKRKPDLFLQMEGSTDSLDAILSSREDFNDYHEVDRRWRPRFRKLKGKSP